MSPTLSPVSSVITSKSGSSVSVGTAITVCFIWPKTSEKLSCLDRQWIKHVQYKDNPTVRVQNLKADLEFVLRGVVGQRFCVQNELRDEHRRLTGGFGEGGLESKQNSESNGRSIQTIFWTVHGEVPLFWHSPLRLRGPADSSSGRESDRVAAGAQWARRPPPSPPYGERCWRPNSPRDGWSYRAEKRWIH